VRVMIELKTEDADGRGGDILMSMGMKRSQTTPNHFRALVLSEPDDPHWDDRDLAMPYIEALRDEDITPRRVKVKTRSIPYNMMTSSASTVSAAENPIASIRRKREAAIKRGDQDAISFWNEKLRKALGKLRATTTTLDAKSTENPIAAIRRKRAAAIERGDQDAVSFWNEKLRKALGKLKGAALAKASSDEMDEDAEPDEPQEDDLVTEDHSNFYESGKKVLTVDPEATEHEMWLAIIKYMKKSNYYPNVWFVSDHGNAHLMSPPKGMHLPG
jgi:hypothetical protein